VEIESLRWVVTLAEELHFGRASQLHYVSAGHFGRQIQRLERQLGVRLFDRTSRRVTLTPAGQRVVVHARRILATLEDLQNSARLAPPTPSDAFSNELSDVPVGGFKPAICSPRHKRVPADCPARQTSGPLSAAVDCNIATASAAVPGPPG
jgi:DNA-binding transcriptional LysR family regulator